MITSTKNADFFNRENILNINEKVEEEKITSKQYSSFKFDKKMFSSFIDITVVFVFILLQM